MPTGRDVPHELVVSAPRSLHSLAPLSRRPCVLQGPLPRPREQIPEGAVRLPLSIPLRILLEKCRGGACRADVSAGGVVPGVHIALARLEQLTASAHRAARLRADAHHATGLAEHGPGLA